MYINIIVGIIFIVLVVWIVRDFWQSRKSPATIMEEELHKRKERQENIAANLEWLRETESKVLEPVLEAVKEMRATLPDAQRFAVENNNDGIAIIFEKTYVAVTHRVSDFSIDGSAQDFSSQVASSQIIVIERMDAEGNLIIRREASSEEEAIRLIAAEIATALEP